MTVSVTVSVLIQIRNSKNTDERVILDSVQVQYVEERPCEAGITKSRLKSEAEGQRLRPSLWGRNRAPMAEDLSPRLSACEEGRPLSGIQSNRDRSESYCITIGFDHKHVTDFSCD